MNLDMDEKQENGFRQLESLGRITQEKILNAHTKSRSVNLNEEDGNKCPNCGGDDYMHDFESNSHICKNCNPH